MYEKTETKTKKYNNYLSIKEIEEIYTDEKKIYYSVMVELEEIPKEQLSIMSEKNWYSEKGEIFYKELYKNLETKIKKFIKKIETGVDGESDYLTMHFETKKKEEATNIAKYLKVYLSRINDKNILNEFSKLPEEEKFKGIGEDFFKKIFEKLHEKLEFKKENKNKNKMS